MWSSSIRICPEGRASSPPDGEEAGHQGGPARPHDAIGQTAVLGDRKLCYHKNAAAEALIRCESSGHVGLRKIPAGMEEYRPVGSSKPIAFVQETCALQQRSSVKRSLPKSLYRAAYAFVQGSCTSTMTKVTVGRQPSSALPVQGIRQ